LKYLVQEYHDGLLLYEASKREVWDVAASDIKGLQQWFKNHKKQYAWEEPRFKGFVYQCKEKSLMKKVASVVKKNADGDWRSAIKATFNKDSVVVRVSGPYLCKKNENPYVDQLVFGEGEAPVNAKYPYIGVVGKKQKQPKSYEDVRSLVVNDYQEYLEKAWIEKLRTKFKFQVNQEVLGTVNKH
jgi:peptidyl-prolyl cis-trans isomerase SurA